jgi:hypothetical protein
MRTKLNLQQFYKSVLTQREKTIAVVMPLMPVKHFLQDIGIL